MFRIILTNKQAIKRRSIIGTTDQYLSAIVTAEALIESLESDHGIFRQNVLEIDPSEYQIVAYHPNAKIWVSIEKAPGLNDMSSTFAIAEDGTIWHRCSRNAFAGLYSLKKDDEELEKLVIKKNAYHIIQPKMCKP